MSAIQQMILSSAEAPFPVTLTTATDVNLRTAALAQGWSGTAPLVATIPAGQTLSASTTSAYALDIGGSFPNGITLTISGTVNGLGGAGGAGGVNAGNGVDGSIGGNALRATVACTIINLGTISSGGGGQGGSAAVRTAFTSGSTSPGCGTGTIGCINSNSPPCSNGFCNTNTGATGASGTSNGVNGGPGNAGSTATAGTSRSCGGCGGPGCNKIVSCATGSPGNGGLAGSAIVGIANIALTNSGTINGGQV